jgi:hypothetical protein
LCIQGGGPAETMLPGKGNPSVKPSHWHLHTQSELGILFWILGVTKLEKGSHKKKKGMGTITNWAKIRELKMGAEDLRDIATRGAIWQVNSKAETLRNHDDLAG